MRMKMKMNAEVPASYLAHRRRTAWVENSLASSDEDINAKFDWQSVRVFKPYIARFRVPAILSVALMLVYTVLNLANPYPTGGAIDPYTSARALGGLAGLSGIL